MRTIHENLVCTIFSAPPGARNITYFLLKYSFLVILYFVLTFKLHFVLTFKLHFVLIFKLHFVLTFKLHFVLTFKPHFVLIFKLHFVILSKKLKTCYKFEFSNPNILENWSSWILIFLTYNISSLSLNRVLSFFKPLQIKINSLRSNISIDIRKNVYFIFFKIFVIYKLQSLFEFGTILLKPQTVFSLLTHDTIAIFTTSRYLHDLRCAANNWQ